VNNAVPEWIDPDDEVTTKYVTEDGTAVCGACDGTGEGYKFATCCSCNGTGEEFDIEDAYDAYIDRCIDAREDALS
jgi:RecJ-like exonuclease